MNIVLTGFMGTGKSSVGKKLADLLGWQYFDTDEMIEHDTRTTIADIFDKRGEPFFRNEETRAARSISKKNNCVIATGGGIVLKKENMEIFEKTSLIVNLSASPEVIFERTKNDTTRPLLNKPDPMQEIIKLLEARKPYYVRCNISINTDNLSVDEVVEKIAEYARNQLNKNSR
ncbi:MAG: hypothetical protein A2297_02935 [Elusimicrobia bacterium RIFOXYB2_FULL_48_7]|nr:MAG: hypothetical protein A2297_02935 [Elusimicrobia bacterium RIFOXYB2_FULL_48_7]